MESNLSSSSSSPVPFYEGTLSPLRESSSSSSDRLCESLPFLYSTVERISCYLVVYVEPVLCSIGFFLNCACIIVFLSVSSHGYFRKTSLLLYMIALTFCNALQLLLSVFVIILPAMEGYLVDSYPSETAELRKLNTRTVRFGYPLMLAANYAAIWLLALICAQRFQAICHPANPWKKRLSCVRRSKAAVLIVAVAAIALNLLRYWELELDEEGNLVHTNIKKSIVYIILQEGVCYGVIVYGFPILILLWLNLNICKLIRNKEIHVQAASRRPAEYRTALMTVCVFVFFFLCCTLAASLRLFMIATNNTFDSLLWLVDVSNLLMNINALITPILYFIFTRGFRDLFFVIRFAPAKYPQPFGVMEKSPLNGEEEEEADDTNPPAQI